MNFCAIQKREHNHNDVNEKEEAEKRSNEATGAGDTALVQQQQRQ